MTNSDPVLASEVEIYNLYKDEIKREDSLAFQRSTSSLTFQGFIFASSTFLISNPWLEKPEVAVYPFRLLMLLLQGIAGLVTALLTAVSVMAASASIAAVTSAYKTHSQYNNKRVPQIRGSDQQHKAAGVFAVGIHIALAALWTAYLAGMMLCLYSASVGQALVIALVVALVSGGILMWAGRYLRAQLSVES